jgi:hypothetical protein
LELSSTPTQPRSSSTSKGREKVFPSRIECYSSLCIHNTLISQRRTTTGGTRTRARSKNKKPQQTEIVSMIIAVHREHDHQLKSPHLIKKDDPSTPTIEAQSIDALSRKLSMTPD